MDNNENNLESSVTSKLRAALAQLQESDNFVEQAILEFESQDLPKENERLRESAKALTERLQCAETALADLKKEYELLEGNFKEELRYKRSLAFSVSEAKMQDYFSTRLSGETERLNLLRAQLYQRLDQISYDLKLLEGEDFAMLQSEVDMLGQKAKIYTDAAQRRAEYEWANLRLAKDDALKKMQESDIKIENDALEAVKKFFSWETFFGLRLISSLGVLLIIIGVFTFGSYIFVRLGPEIQCAFIFAIGFVFLVAGELLNQKWRGIFSLAITAAGSAILFLATALGHLTLGVLPMEAALGICAGVCALGFVLSIRHNSQTISVFALIGGYLPMLALGGEFIVWAAIYFTILNLFSFALSTKKNWGISRFIGLFAGMAAELVIISYIGLGWAQGNQIKIAVISLIALAYIAYLVIPVFGALFTKTKIRPADIVLLSCNLFFRFLIGLYASYAFGFEKYNALVPAFFAFSCICMALLSEQEAHESLPQKDRGSLRALFFVTSISFSALIVLFWFDKVWFSSGWLIEGAGLFFYGIIKNRKRFVVAGSFVGALCAIIFLCINLSTYQSPLFLLQYIFITVGFAAAAGLLSFKKIPEKYPDVSFFQFVAALNVWIFAIYLFQNPLYYYLENIMQTRREIVNLACIVAGLVFSYVLPKIRAICCVGIKTASVIAGFVSIIWLFVFNGFSGGITSGVFGNGEKALLLALYICTNLLSVFSVNDLLCFMVSGKALSSAAYPLLLSGYFVVSAILNLAVQLKLGASSMIITLIFGFAALGHIIYGFAKRNHVMRISGLCLSFFAVFKLFVFDLFYLSTELKIAAYFMLGVLLLAISFVYQYFNKKLNENLKNLEEKNDNNNKK